MSAYSWDLDSNTSGDGEKVTFTKFPEGITRIRVIDNAPYQRWTHFIKRASRSINCPGKGCPICDIRRGQKANKMPYTYPMAKRFAINVINRETGNVEIMEQGKTFFQDLQDLMGDLKQENNKLIDADIKVRRRGLGQDDTSYRLDIEKVYPLSADDEKLLEKRVKFEEYFKAHTIDQITRIVKGEAWEDVMKNDESNETPVEGNETESVDTDKHIELPEDESIELA